MVQIFISYAREDYAVVRQLYNRLRTAKYKPWMDKVDLPKGADFAKAIPKFLRESDLFIVCLSPRSVEKRSFIQREINLALDVWEQKLEDDLYIFPVRLEACKAPERISAFNWTDLFGDDHEEEWNLLLQTLNAQAQRLSKDVMPLKENTPPPKTNPSTTRNVAVTGEVQQGTIITGDHNTIIIGETHKSPASPENTLPLANFTETINGVPLEMILIPTGKFIMGETINDDEKPPHKVTVPSFHISKYQITQAQWKAVMGDKSKPYFKGKDLPIESISWSDAKEFCTKVSRMTSTTFRLPSEAEWEYACRAGTPDDQAIQLDEIAWYSANSKGKTHPVGHKKPNNFGLFDMRGNVWEWCEDVWHANYDSAPKDGSAWTNGGNQKRRVLRGGSWGGKGSLCRSALRLNSVPDTFNLSIGFRVVATARTL